MDTTNLSAAGAGDQQQPLVCAHVDGLCLEHAASFIRRMLETLGAGTLHDVAPVSSEPAYSVQPTLIYDFRKLTESERRAICDSYHSRFGVAYFIVMNPEERPRTAHPLFDIAQQLASDLHLQYPLPHPMEGHSEAVARFGPSDGTYKIYDVANRGGGRYKEQAETNETFDFHHDGLGSGGTVETAVLYTESGPLFGGYTYFQNIPLLSLELAQLDCEAFASLFLPDALTIIRPRGKGAIKVQTPVLFLNEEDQPQSFFRTPSGEYKVHWRADIDPLRRARSFFDRFAPAFSYGSCFVHLVARGHGIFINNRVNAHARTPFIDDAASGKQRVLSRKWFMRSARDSVYKHVPGMFIAHRFHGLYPAQCAPQFLQGEWNYDPSNDQNIRIR